jgi:ABC-type antimicrobial peptide transport system permease subunit
MFGGASDIAGRTIRVNGFPVTIVGVLPRGFDGLLPGQSADLVLPLAFEGFLHGEHSQRQAPGSAWLLVMGRRRVGVSMAQTAAELDVIRANVVNSAMSRRLQMTDFKSLRLDVTPGRYGWSVHQMEYRRPFIILQALALLLGTIVCANVAGLLLARAAARRHEFQLRSAIGAHAAQLRRHLIAESLLAALAAAPVSAIVAVSIGVTVASVLAEGNFFGAGVQMPIEVGALFIGVTAAGCLLATFAAHFTPGVLLLRSTRIERLRNSHYRSC